MKTRVFIMILAVVVAGAVVNAQTLVVSQYGVTAPDLPWNALHPTTPLSSGNARAFKAIDLSIPARPTLWSIDNSTPGSENWLGEIYPTMVVYDQANNRVEMTVMSGGAEGVGHQTVNYYGGPNVINMANGSVSVSEFRDFPESPEHQPRWGWGGERTDGTYLYSCYYAGALGGRLYRIDAATHNYVGLLGNYSATKSYWTDNAPANNGNGVQLPFDFSGGMAYHDGLLYLPSRHDGRIYTITTATKSANLDGGGVPIPWDDGTGPAFTKEWNGDTEFGPDGYLYVTNALDKSIHKYQGPTMASPGTYAGAFVATGAGLGHIWDIAFDSTQMYVAHEGDGTAGDGIFVYNLASGSLVDTINSGFGAIRGVAYVVGGPAYVDGDTDKDGDVDLDDLSMLASNWNTPSGMVWADGDFDGDGDVDLDDLSSLAGNWQYGVTGAVPEPATIGLLTLGGLAMLRRRR